MKAEDRRHRRFMRSAVTGCIAIFFSALFLMASAMVVYQWLVGLPVFFGIINPIMSLVYCIISLGLLMFGVLCLMQMIRL